MPYQDYALNQLIINKLSQEQYNALATAGEISANQLYFIEAAGNIDAASGTIENVADPINNTDAANKQYVDSFTTNSLSSYTELTASNDISALLNANITYVSSQVSGIPANITYVSSSLSGYSPKSDVIYVSGQVSSIPLTITSLSSTVSSDYALKTEIPTSEDLGLSNYAAVSTVTNLNNALTSEIDELNTTLTGLISSTSSITLTEAKTYSTNLISAYYYNETTRAANPDATGIKIESDNAGITFHVDDGGSFLHISSTEFDNVEIPTNINNIITNSLTRYALSSDVTSYVNSSIAYYAPVSTVTDLSNSLSGYSTNSNVNLISSTLNTNITYVSSQVSGIPPTITSLSSTVSSDYALKTDIPTTESLGLSSYATVSSVTNLSNSLSSYALSSDVTAYVDQQIGNINAILETI